MGSLKKTKQSNGRKLMGASKHQSLAAEQYRSIRTNINFSMPSTDLKTILFTSAAKGEGKSTTSCNVAIAYAEAGKRVLLVDADMRRPTLHHSFKLPNRTGLSSLLMRKGSLQDTVERSGIVGLDLLLCGHVPANPAELLSSTALDSLIYEMKEYYDLVIFDSPPILTVADSKILANKCDGTVLVVNSGKSDKNSAAKAKDALISSKAIILGVVLNNYKLEKGQNYYQDYHS